MSKHQSQKTMAVLVVSGLLFLAGCGKETDTSDRNLPAPPDEPPTNPTSLPVEPSISPTPSKSIVKPEHQGKPTYTNEETNQYMVLLEPMPPSGDLNLTMITLETDEVTPVVVNCTDLHKNGDRALLQVGRPDGLEETVGDYIAWFSAAFHHFCNQQNGTSTSSQATDPSPRTTPQTTTLPETPARLISEIPGSKINVRSGPADSALAPAYGYAGDRVALLAESTDDAGILWYQVRFEESEHVGWVRGDFVTTDSGYSIPTPIP